MRIIIFTFALTFYSLSLFGQSKNGKSASLDAGSIESQYEYLRQKSNDYQQYEVVRRDFLNKFFGNVSDTLKSNYSKIENLSSKISSQEENVDSLKSQVITLESDLEQLEKEKNSFALFGILLKKGTYNTILWSLILGLLGALILYMYRFNRSHVVTAKARENLAKTKADFDAFRKKTLEKEQVLMRKLQDELNKNEMNMS